jgi:hypothetical protein
LASCLGTPTEDALATNIGDFSLLCIPCVGVVENMKLSHWAMIGQRCFMQITVEKLKMRQCKGLLGRFLWHKFVHGLTLRQFKKISPDFPKGWAIPNIWDYPGTIQYLEVCKRCGELNEVNNE